ncbi:hypothetical protein ANRL1_00701 [Anaerolineae bacterium]|nr:hypothetical protein ANRL1_00701 [Anaerolineae bacterium]
MADRQSFRFRIAKGDADIAAVLDSMSDGDASQFVKEAIREKVGVPTPTSRLAQIEQLLQAFGARLERAEQLIQGVFNKL